MTHVKSAPAVTPRASPLSDTDVGVEFDAVVNTWPSCPFELLPKHCTCRDASNTHVCASPEATCVPAAERGAVAIGCNTFELAVVPRRPDPKLPQHHAAPTVEIAHECVAPISR
jgi:hypothetical protein